jgi:outer membrane protein OmpU
MKKFLFGTTALAAVGFAVLAAAPANAQTAPAPGFRSNAGFTVGISGYARQYVGMAQTKNAAPSNYNGTLDQHSDWRPIFNFAMPLANGMTAGAVLQFNPLANTTNNAGVSRRQWSFLSGGFGQVQLGQHDTVGAQMHVGSAEMFVGGTVKNQGKIYDFISAPSGNIAATSTVGTTNPDALEARSNKISYFSPRFEGFQIGGSYTPETSYDRNGVIANGTQYTENWNIAANYLNTLGGVGVRAYGSYLQMNVGSKYGMTDVQANSMKDAKHYGVGLGFTYMGFDLAGSWGKIKDGVLNTVGNTTTAAALGTVGLDGSAFDAGLSYTFGSFGVGYNYFVGKNDAHTFTATGKTPQPNGEDKRTGHSISGRYVMGPGVNLEAIVFQVKQKTGLATPTTANLANRETKATGAVTALILAF